MSFLKVLWGDDSNFHPSLVQNDHMSPHHRCPLQKATCGP